MSVPDSTGYWTVNFMDRDYYRTNKDETDEQGIVTIRVQADSESEARSKARTSGEVEWDPSHVASARKDTKRFRILDVIQEKK